MTSVEQQIEDDRTLNRKTLVGAKKIARKSSQRAQGAGDGVYHSAPFFKKGYRG